MQASTEKQKQPPQGTVLSLASGGYDARGVSEGVGEAMSPAGAIESAGRAEAASEGKTEASGLLTGVSEGPGDTAGASAAAAEALGSVETEAASC